MHANNYSIGTQKNPVDSYYALKTIAFLVQHVILNLKFRATGWLAKIMNFLKSLLKNCSI